MALGRTAALALSAAAAGASGSWVGPSDCVRDEHGCCASAGFFYCGSSGRCTHDWDQCEDGLGESSASCALDYEYEGVVASYDLSPLRIRTGDVDYEANATTKANVIFNLCSNAATPRACVNTTGGDGVARSTPAAAFAVFDDDGDGGHERCARLSGSAYAGDTFAARALFEDVEGGKPTRGVALDYGGGDICAKTGKAATFTVAVLCDPTATAAAPLAAATVRDDGCGFAAVARGPSCTSFGASRASSTPPTRRRGRRGNRLG